MREKEYSGKVLSKYIDTKNHNSETIELKMYTDTILVALTLDKSGLYDFVNKGDSIVKIKGEGVVKVFRAMTKVETFMIERNCKD